MIDKYSKVVREEVVLTKEKKRKYFKAFLTAFDLLKEQAPDIVFDLDKDKIKYIFRDYDKIAYCVKNEMLQLREEENIDSHKISAIFLITILKHANVVKAEQNFAKLGKAQLSTFHYIPHIYFSFILGTVIMEGLYNENNPEDKVVFDINLGYGKEFAKMIFANQKAILSPALSMQCNNSAKGAFCLSHLFYFIERVADKQPDTQ